MNGELLDLRTLPRVGVGRRSTVLWGVLLLVLIEAIAMLAMVTSYFYLAVVRGGAFPHASGAPPDPTRSAIGLGLLVLAAVAAHGAEKAARAERPVLLRGALALAALLGAGYLALGVLGLGAKEFTASSHAYGSIVWTIEGYQTLHGLALVAVTTAFVGFTFSHRLEGERRGPLQALAAYWDFVVASGAVVFFTVDLSPHLL